MCFWQIFLATPVQTSMTILLNICLLHNIIICRKGIEHYLPETHQTKPRNVIPSNIGIPKQATENIRNLFKTFLCRSPM